MIGFSVSLAGGVAALFTIIRAASGAPFELLALILCLWVASPFVILSGASVYFSRMSPSIEPLRAAAITSCIVVPLSVFIYAQAVFSPASSTSPLVFLFVPFSSLVAAAVVFLLSSFVLRWHHSYRHRGV